MVIKKKKLQVESPELYEIGQVILGGDALDDIIEWYLHIVSKRPSYVVFVVRRCYMLALIMEKITGIRMEDKGETVYMTDAAFSLQCHQLADYYLRYQMFPSILLVDDILIHGRNLNKLIYKMEQQVCRCILQAADSEKERKVWLFGCDEEDIKAAFMDAVVIDVYTCAQGGLLLWERYKRKLMYRRKMKPRDWRQLSSDISTMILCSNVTNASYIFTEYLSEDEFDRINSDLEAHGFLSTVYQNTREYTRTRYLVKGDRIKVAYTLRIIENSLCDGYRVAPYVFLPSLSHEESMRLQDAVLKKVKQMEGCRRWLKEMTEQGGSRSFNEIYTLIFSHVLLQEFNKEFHIQRDINSPDWAAEIEKLARNYYFIIGQRDKCKYLKVILQKELFTGRELDSLFEDCISNGQYFACYNQIDEPLEPGFDKKMFRIEEEYFYKKGYEAEKDACQLSRQPYIPNEGRLSTIQLKEAEWEIRDLQEYSKIYSLNKIQYMLACFFQLTDAGIIGIVSNVMQSFKGINYSQYVKYGEQAMLIRPLQLYEYIPMLSMMQRKSMQWGWDLTEAFDRFINSPFSDMDRNTAEELREFIKKLEGIEQKPDDWNGNYLLKKSETEEMTDEDALTWLHNFQKKREKYANQYSAYLNAHRY